MRMSIAVAACAFSVVLAQIDLAQAAYPGAVPEPVGVSQVSKLPLASKEARKDIGCIGYRGTSSGESQNGKCVKKKPGSKTKS
jgi:hypothetical protein